MSKKTITNEKLEIVVSTYWPTTLLKSVEIKNNTDSIYNKVNLKADEAHYLYMQLKTLFENSDIETEGGLQHGE